MNHQNLNFYYVVIWQTPHCYYMGKAEYRTYVVSLKSNSNCWIIVGTKSNYQKISHVVEKTGSKGGNSFWERRLRYTGPTERLPFLPSLPSSTLTEKAFILPCYQTWTRHKTSVSTTVSFPQLDSLVSITTFKSSKYPVNDRHQKVNHFLFYY